MDPLWFDTINFGRPLYNILRGHRNKWRILGECLLISSLPGKALRTLVDKARLAEI